MTQRREQIEALLDTVQDLVAEYYAAAVKDVIDTTRDDKPIDRLKTVERMARAGRCLKLFRASGRKTIAAIAALPGRLEAAPPPDEAPMDEEARRNEEERVARLYAEFDRRLEVLYRTPERQKYDQRDGFAGAGGPAVQEPG